MLDTSCKICNAFSDSQKELLATPSYRIRKDKKAGLLVSPKDMTVISPVDTEPTFQSPCGPSAQSSAQLTSSTPVTMASSSSAQASGFVTSDQFMAMSDKWAEQFARMEALLSRGNIFSTPVLTVKPVDSQQLISETPFLPPATRPTGPVMAPVAVEASVKPKSVTKTVEERKKSHKSNKTEDLAGKDHNPDKKRDSKSHKKRDRSSSPVPKHSFKQEHSGSPLAVSSSGPESDKQSELKKGHMLQPSGSEQSSTGHTGQSSSVSQQPDYGHFSTGACAYPPDTADT